ncbi:unnamed protein product [Lampetra fluviatilis]
MQELDGSRTEGPGSPMEGSKNELRPRSVEMQPGRDGEHSSSSHPIGWQCPRAAACAVVLAGCGVALAGVCTLSLLAILNRRSQQQQQQWTLPCRERGHHRASCSLEVDTTGATLTVTVPRDSAEPALLAMDARHVSAESETTHGA